MARINKKQIQLDKLNAKVEKLLSKNDNNDTLKNDLQNIVNQFGELKIRPINRLIKEKVNQYKLDVKINKLASKKNISRE